MSVLWILFISSLEAYSAISPLWQNHLDLSEQFAQLDLEKKKLTQSLSLKKDQKKRMFLQKKLLLLGQKQEILAKEYLTQLEAQEAEGQERVKRIETLLNDQKMKSQGYAKQLLEIEVLERSMDTELSLEVLSRLMKKNLDSIFELNEQWKVLEQTRLESQQEQLHWKTVLSEWEKDRLQHSSLLRVTAAEVLRPEFLTRQVSLPVDGGQIMSQFGRSFDPASGLYVFKKGLEIAVKPARDVRAIGPGRIVFSGEMPHYGKVVIIDHGNHFHSLSAQLGVLLKQVGDWVQSDTVIGLTSSVSFYFELRSHSVAVNPLQWLKN